MREATPLVWLRDAWLLATAGLLRGIVRFGASASWITGYVLLLLILYGLFVPLVRSVMVVALAVLVGNQFLWFGVYALEMMRGRRIYVRVTEDMRVELWAYAAGADVPDIPE